MDSNIVALWTLGITVVMYVTEIVPLAVTAMLSCMALGILGCCSIDVVFSGFSNNTTLMVLGMSIVGNTFFCTGAASYIGSKITKIFGGNERVFLLVCIALTAFLSAFLSNTATVAMMLPIAGAAVVASKGKLRKKTLYMPIGFAAVAGGGATLIGSTPQIVAQGIFEQYELEQVAFFDYFFSGLIKVILMMMYFATVGYFLLRHNLGEDATDTAKENNNSNDNEMFTPKMLISTIILILCVVGYIFQVWNIAIVAMLGVVLCIVTKCVSFKEAFQKVDWNTVILLACSLGFASGLKESGAVSLLVDATIGLIGDSPNHFLVYATIAVLSSAMGNIISTTATTLILSPICYELALNLGMNPRSLIFTVVVFVNIVYTSPSSTPPNSMTLAGGYKYLDYVKVGGLLNVITVAILIFFFPLIYPI